MAVGGRSRGESSASTASTFMVTVSTELPAGSVRCWCFRGRVPAGVVIEDPVSLRDLAATIVNLANPEETPFSPGSPWPRFWGTDAVTEPADSLLSELTQLHRTTTGQYADLPRSNEESHAWAKSRLIWNGDGVNELFDLDQDTLEMREPPRKIRRRQRDWSRFSGLWRSS